MIEIKTNNRHLYITGKDTVLAVNIDIDALENIYVTIYTTFHTFKMGVYGEPIDSIINKCENFAQALSSELSTVTLDLTNISACIRVEDKVGLFSQTNTSYSKNE